MSAEPRGPAICNVSNIGEGKDEMTKASIDLQDLRRRIYVKAKAEPSWRFWGLPEEARRSSNEAFRCAAELDQANLTAHVHDFAGAGLDELLGDVPRVL